MGETIQVRETPFEAEAIDRLRDGRARMMEQIRKVIVGQDEVIESLLIVLFSGGHCLLTGAPGLAKTLLVRTIAKILDLDFKRVQFTPDLMPSDITGTEIIDEDRVGGHRELRFISGPIFTHILLADEINRTPPKTQAALLEAMEEKQVTIGGNLHALEQPFYVLATQNPIELEGTYPLPEAQLDRFMMNIWIDYLTEDEELDVATRTTTIEAEEVAPVFSGADMLDFSRLVRMVPVAEPVARYAVQLVQASRPGDTAPDFVTSWVSWGAGTRGVQGLLLGAKARALLKGRYHVSFGDVRAVAPNVLRHRILTNFRAEADRVNAEDVINRLLETIQPPEADLV